MKTLSLYHGSRESDLTRIKEGHGLFHGIFASDSRRAALSRGDYLYRVNVKKVLTGFALNHEIPWEKTAKAIKDLGFNPESEVIETAVLNDRAIKVDQQVLCEFFGVADWADAMWAAQRVRGQIAKALGYSAVEMSDEFGTSYLIVAPLRLYRCVD